jgi:hypothetical protein
MTRQPLRATRPEDLPAPRVDEVSELVAREAIDEIAKLRTPYWLGDAVVQLHALSSLLAQAQHLVPAAVHDARLQGYTWAEIGQLLNLAPDTAARRYRTRTRTGDQP